MFRLLKRDKLEKRDDEIVAKVEALKLTKQWQATEFTPLTSTWLNQRRWDIELADIPEADGADAELAAQIERVKLKEAEDA